MIKLINYCAGALISILCVSFVGCNEPADPEQPKPPELPEIIGTVPVPAPDIPDEVNAFFEKHLPRYTYSYSESKFNFSNIDHSDKEFFLINSMEEFEAVSLLSVELPAIDFEKHTLIIGQHWMGCPGYTLEKQAVDTEPEEMTLSLVYRPMGICPAVTAICNFWGLYPKLPEKLINVDVITILN